MNIIVPTLAKPIMQEALKLLRKISIYILLKEADLNEIWTGLLGSSIIQLNLSLYYHPWGHLPKFDQFLNLSTNKLKATAKSVVISGSTVSL